MVGLSKINLNLSAFKIFKKLCNNAEKYRVLVEKTKSGATLVDAGLNAIGGFLAGKMVTEICLGGYGQVDILPIQYGDVVLPSVYVQTDFPALSTLASQFAGWHIKSKGYSAIGSGPARAIALKPKKLYKKLKYSEVSDKAVLVLETERKPPEEVILMIAEKCNVKPKNLYLVIFSTTSLVGSIQVSGRIVETGLHKLERIGLDTSIVTSAWGYVPIVPLHPESSEAMGRTNDAILYGGITNYTVDHEDDNKLKSIVMQAPSSSSKIMQEARKTSEHSPRFLDIFKEAEFDFYKIDPNIFAPAVISINNLRTGKIFCAGQLDITILKELFGL